MTLEFLCSHRTLLRGMLNKCVFFKTVHSKTSFNCNAHFTMLSAWKIVCMMYRIQSGMLSLAFSHARGHLSCTARVLSQQKWPKFECPLCWLRFKSQRQTFLAKFTVQCAWSPVVQSSKTCYISVAYSTKSFITAQASCSMRNYDNLHSSLQCPTYSKSN